MEKALPELQTGGEEHKAVLDSLTKLAKAFPASAAVPGVQKTALAGLAQRANSDAMIKQAMASMGPKPGGPPGLGAAPPQPAPMGAM